MHCIVYLPHTLRASIYFPLDYTFGNRMRVAGTIQLTYHFP